MSQFLWRQSKLLKLWPVWNIFMHIFLSLQICINFMIITSCNLEAYKNHIMSCCPKVAWGELKNPNYQEKGKVEKVILYKCNLQRLEYWLLLPFFSFLDWRFEYLLCWSRSKMYHLELRHFWFQWRAFKTNMWFVRRCWYEILHTTNIFFKFNYIFFCTSM